MKKNSPLRARFHTTLDLEKRIELVISLQRSLGHVSRKALIEEYGLTQLEAGSLMRDFLHAHAKNLEWDMTNTHYKMKT